MRKAGRERYAEKNASLKEEKTRRNNERTRQFKKKPTRKELALSKTRKEINYFQSKLENASLLMEGETGSLLHQLLEISQKKRRDPTRYSNYIMEVADKIMYHSPAAYSYLRDTLILPLLHRSTLMRVTQLLSDTGDSNHTTRILSQTSSKHAVCWLDVGRNEHHE